MEKKDGLLDYLYYIILFFIAVLVLINRNSLFYEIIIIGFGALISGIYFVIKRKDSGYLVFSFGLSILLSSLFYKTNILNKSETLTFMLCSTIGVFMFLTLIFEIINKKRSHKIYSIVVKAKVVDLIKNPNTKEEYYMPIYEYIIDGKIFQVEFPSFVFRDVPEIGHEIDLNVDPNNYESVYFDKTKKMIIKDFLIEFILFIICLIVVVSLFI